MRLAFVTSHPIQYYAPLFRALAKQLELVVFFAHRVTASDQAKAGFGIEFDWDVELLSGYAHEFLRNVAAKPGLDHFFGCDTPQVGNRLSQSRFDAVVVQGWYLKTFIQTLVAAKRQGLPIIARGDSQLDTPRSPLKRGIKAGVFPFYLKLFDAGLYVGERSRRYWTRYGYPHTRLFFSPHCVDTGWFSSRATTQARKGMRARLGIGEQTRVALFAGKLVSFKRPVDAVTACALLKAGGRDVCLLVAGAGPLEKHISQAARSAGLPCKMLGFCNQSEMPQVYAAADALILPSDGRETWGLVANEALACGLPVVLSDAVGSAIDLAADRSVGRSFPMGDTNALADVLAEIFDHPPSASAIAAKSAHYSIERAVEGIVLASEFVGVRRHASDLLIKGPVSFGHATRPKRPA
jgi:glycosyltransferase involved in cell wall biosynthesis